MASDRVRHMAFPNAARLRPTAGGRKTDTATYMRNRKPIAEWRYEQSHAFSSKKEPSPKHPDTQRAP